MKKIFLSLLTIFMVLSLSVALVKASETTTVAIEDGVQIRTDGNNGLKWVANVTNHKDSNEYGFLFAQGDLAEVTVNTANVVNKVVEGVTAEEPVMAATMVNFPKKAAAQDISVVAYVKDGENYSYSNVVVRNLAEVAIYAKNNLDGEFINSIVEYASTRYMKVYSDRLNSFYVENLIYESDPAKLYVEFANDWNKKFGAIELDPNATGSTLTAGLRKYLQSGTKEFSTNCDLYQFFYADTTLKAKWSWLLKLLDGKPTTNDPLSSQIQCLTGELTELNGDNFYYGLNLVSRLGGYFTQNYYSTGVGGCHFENYPEFFASTIINNKTVYANLTDAKIVEIGESVNLPVITERNGYEPYYIVNSNSYSESNYIVTSSSVQFIPKYNIINYSISYYDNTDPISSLSSTYTIESSDITLPEYEKVGYSFEGWYTSPTFEEDTKVTKITTGSTGNKVLYAKMVESSNVPVSVTYDLNGGYYLDRDIKTTDFIGGAYNAIDWGKYQNYISLGTSGRAWWSHVTLDETEVPGIYAVTGRGSSGGTSAVLDCDIALLYTSGDTNSGHDLTIPELYNLCVGLTVGQLVAISNIPTTNTTSAAINVSVYDNEITLADFGTNITVEYTLETDLITPAREGYVFLGWKSSVDEAVVNKYPGYTTNPGAITYTAQWRPTTLIVDGTTEAWHYETLAAALAVATNGDTIKLAAGTYSENVTIANLSNLTILGPNAGINPNTSTRESEAVITGTLTLEKVSNFKLDGVALSGAGNIITGSDQILGLTFTNLNVYDRDAISTWIEGTSTTNFLAAINIKSGSNYSLHTNIVINNSKFDTREECIKLYRVDNISITNNQFLDCERDAIRVEGGYNGNFTISNNIFSNENNDGYNAIYFRIHGNSSGKNSNIIISNNEFKKCGYTTATSNYKGAISNRGYQENGASWTITGNTFEDCYDYIRIRNNGAAESSWSLSVSENTFIGEPTGVYYSCFGHSSSDTSTTNPSLAVFTENIYKDAEGNVITPDDSKFIGVKTNDAFN